MLGKSVDAVDRPEGCELGDKDVRFNGVDGASVYRFNWAEGVCVKLECIDEIVVLSWPDGTLDEKLLIVGTP